jgi:hypothetical protein
VLSRALGHLLFSMFINDIVHQITSSRVHLYVDDVQTYISFEPHRIENCIRNMNIDLDRVHWELSGHKTGKILSITVQPIYTSFAYRFTTSPRIKSYFIRRQCNKLGIIFNQELTRHDQVDELCMGVFFTGRRLWTFSHFTPFETCGISLRTTIFIRRRNVF